MPHGIYTETDVPPGKVNDVIATLKLEDDPPTNIQQIKQPNGNVTIVATWPDGSNTSS